MNAKNKLRMVFGVAVVFAIIAGLFVYLDFTMSRKYAKDANLESTSFTIGLGYSGIIEKSYIDIGDTVASGDKLFDFRSPTLAQALQDNEISRNSLLYSLNDIGVIEITASANGQVQDLEYREGAFVPANSTIAVINSENSLYTTATFALSPPDYARISRDSAIDVVLPDRTLIHGKIYDITLDNDDDTVLTTVKVRIDQDKINTVSFGAGTPVQSTLYLNTETWSSRIANFVTSLFQPRAGS